ncbi:MAG TPA: F0F1 ATP synthase subunit B [Actinomycetaceae bacterium]|nr:F0F1 ATP synthase subunit B [Actinomycetaceae bacterium]
MLAAARVAAEAEQNVLLPAGYDILWSAVSIAVIAIVIVKVVLPAFNKVLDERTEKIEGGLAAGADARAEAERLRAEIERELTEARVEAARIRQQADEDGAAIVAEAREKAQAESERIVTAGQRNLEAERQQAATALRNDVGALATSLAERIIGETLRDDAARSRVIDRFLDELEDSDSTNLVTTTEGQDGQA